MEFKITGTGTRPILFHNVQLASPLNPYAKRLKALNSKTGKTDEDRMEVARIEFEGSLYLDEDLGPVIPGQNIFASLIEGARQKRGGKKVERGIIISDYQVPLLYDGPRTVEGLWGGGESDHVDIRPVSVQRQKVDRCRPIFRNWGFEVSGILDTSGINEDEFRDYVQLAGLTAGLGDYRRVFGRYSSEVVVWGS